MFKRLAHCYHRLPHYLRSSPWIGIILSPWFYYKTVPHHQDAAVIILTMGKVGSITIARSLQNAGVRFRAHIHQLIGALRFYPYRKPDHVKSNRVIIFMRWVYYPWVIHRPRVRVITMVREPISRLISLYLFTYSMRFGVRLEEVPLKVLLDNFPRIFEQDFEHPLVPSYFLSSQIEALTNIDVYKHPSPAVGGSTAIEHGRFLLLIMKLEIPDEQKADALSAWMNRSIPIMRKNTAAENDYGSIYEEFKKRVSIPYRYAEAIYQSSYMKHFYTPDERAKYWKRWEPQLDRSITLPDWVEDQLQTYHPPVEE